MAILGVTRKGAAAVIGAYAILVGTTSSLNNGAPNLAEARQYGSCISQLAEDYAQRTGYRDTVPNILYRLQSEFLEICKFRATLKTLVPQ